MSFGSSITELPSLVWNMIRNKVFMIVTLTSCSEFSIVVAFLTFMPKYIQDQFSIDPSKVSKVKNSKNSQKLYQCISQTSGSNIEAKNSREICVLLGQKNGSKMVFSDKISLEIGCW